MFPKAVQYLDRGGLTFFKPIFWSWLNTLELKIVEQLNHKSYWQYGDKLFDIANTEIHSNQILLHEFTHGAAEIDDKIPKTLLNLSTNFYLVKYLMQDAMNFYAV